MQPTPSYLLLMHSQLGAVPPADDGEGGELFIHRQLRTGLTAEADDPAHAGVPMCRAWSVEIAVRTNLPPARLVFDESAWRFVNIGTE
jgi:hypothetical protein